MERFEKFISPEPNSGCWLWDGQWGTEGYGRFKIRGRPCSAHRVSFILHCGEIPDGLCVLHRCDNRCCVNPDHLFLGSHSDNMADRDKKGRYAHGTRNPKAKLTPTQVMAIRAAKKSQRELAREFGVSVLAINSIRRRKTWKNV